MKTSVIISTYNSTEWLRKVMWGYFCQSRSDFEIIVADDGSRDETHEMLSAIASESPVPIAHIWQPDEGFQKCRILNKAIAAARGERLVITDGDCVPRSDFVEVHTRLARPDHFLTGAYFKLPRNISELVSRQDISEQLPFKASWLLRQGLPFTSKLLKLVARPPIDQWLDRVTPTKQTWNGHNASCLRTQAIQINGFNEDMQYGGLDVEFGLRLRHIGIEPRHIRYSTVALHLDHGHGYVTEEMLMRSHIVKETTRDNRLTWAERGLDQWLTPDNRITLGRDDRITRFC